jgi:hypothetical protein
MKNFVEQEFIPKQLWDYFQNNPKYNNGKLAMRHINPKIIAFMEWTRTTFGKPITVNNWHLNLSSTEQTFDGRCLRLPSDSAYKISSDHNYSMAIDFDVEGMEAEEVRQAYIYTYSSFFLALGATTLEKAQNWVHVGFADLNCGWTPEKQSGIWLVNP